MKTDFLIRYFKVFTVNIQKLKHFGTMYYRQIHKTGENPYKNPTTYWNLVYVKDVIQISNNRLFNKWSGNDCLNI